MLKEWRGKTVKVHFPECSREESSGLESLTAATFFQIILFRSFASFSLIPVFQKALHLISSN